MSDPFVAMLDGLYAHPHLAEDAELNGVPVRVVRDHGLTQMGDVLEVLDGNVAFVVRNTSLSARPRRGDLLSLPDGTHYRIERILPGVRDHELSLITSPTTPPDPPPEP